jgi:hypothetical protein
MGGVTRLDERIATFSVRRLAAEFGLSRETVSRRLADGNVRSTGERSGHPVYRLRDACPALLSGAVVDANGVLDPTTLPPERRNAWYMSENRRVELDMTMRRLIPVGEVEAQFSELAKGFIKFLQTLADQLERDASLTPEQVDAMNESIARQRQQLYEQMTKPVEASAPA